VQKSGEIATKETPAVQKRKSDNRGKTTSRENASLFVDAPIMRKIRDGARRAKEKQAES
jgi:hypothetical protein